MKEVIDGLLYVIGMAVLVGIAYLFVYKMYAILIILGIIVVVFWAFLNRNSYNL